MEQRLDVSRSKDEALTALQAIGIKLEDLAGLMSG
jgi:hypothetical protein